MALPKKKSRPITVNDNDYRYAISTTQIDDNWNFSLNLTVQSAKGEGSILKIDGLVTRDVWLDFPNLKKYKKEDYPVFKPSDISRVILTALKKGWIPENERPFILKLDNSFVKNFAIN